MSYKYRYYDVQEYKFKEGKIYDPYKHLRDNGISFMVTRNNTRKIYTAKLDFKKDKIIQSLYFDRKTFDFDTFYQAKNQFFIYDGYNKKYIGSRAYYHRAINYFFQSVGRQIPTADIFIRDYYNTLQPYEKTVICSEKTWEKLRPSEKDKIRFIVSPTTTYINPGLVFVAKQSIRGSALNSILKYAQYVQRVALNDRQISIIQQQFPDFAINEFEQWNFGWIRPNLSSVIRFIHKHNKSYYKQGQWGANDLHIYPSYLSPENDYFFVESKLSKYNNIFKTYKTILNDRVIKNITKAEHDKIQTDLTKNVKVIKDLVKKIGSGNNFNISFVRQNFFIYDDSNFITNTLITEINKKIQIYGEVVIDTTKLNTTNQIIKSDSVMKFNVSKLSHKDKITLEIEDIREKKTNKNIR